MERNRLLTIGAVLAAVVVVALGFIAGISPQLRAAATAESDNATVMSQNAALQAGITSLESKFSKLDSLTTQLADLQKSVPADAASPAFLNEINSLANKTHVSITALTMSDALAYVAPTAASTTTTPAVAGTAPVAPAAVTNAAITGSNFSVIPVTITVTGTYGEALSFLSALHNGTRLFLATAFAGSDSSAADGTSGSWVVTGAIYALTDAQTAQQSQQTATSTAAGTAGSGSSTDTAAGK